MYQERKLFCNTNNVLNLATLATYISTKRAPYRWYRGGSIIKKVLIARTLSTFGTATYVPYSQYPTRTGNLPGGVFYAPEKVLYTFRTATYVAYSLFERTVF